MSPEATQLTCLRDPRIAPYALSARPAWLWTPDGSRILWTNAAGAAAFASTQPAALAQRRFDNGQPLRTTITRIARTLSRGQPPRLERIRGLGAATGGFTPATCECQRLEIGGTEALLIVGLAATARDLSVHDRIARLLCDIEEPVALFSASGDLLHATHPAADTLAAATTLSFLGLDGLAAEALRGGHASGSGKTGAIRIERIDAGDGALLLADFAPGAAITETRNAATRTAHDDAPPSATDLLQDALQKGEQESEQEGEQDAAHTPWQEASSADDGAAAEEAARDSAHEAAPDALQETRQEPRQESPRNDRPSAPLLHDPVALPSTLPTERRYPVRFVWQIDPEGRFAITSDEFLALVGPSTERLMGKTWPDIRSALALDPQDRVAHALASHETWSGIGVGWPIDGSEDRVAVEMSGLPIFERERAFSGYRGFGVCRDVFAPPHDAPASIPSTLISPTLMPPRAPEPPVFTIAASTANVLPFKSANGERAASLSPVERNAFHELARQLTTRLQQGHVAADPSALSGDRSTDADAETPHRASLAADLIPVFDSLPCGVLVYRQDRPLYANAAFLRWAGYASLSALIADGGLDAVVIAPVTADAGTHNAGPHDAYDARGVLCTVFAARAEGAQGGARRTRIRWDEDEADLLTLTGDAAPVPADIAAPPAPAMIHDVMHDMAAQEHGQLRAILDASADGIVVIDERGRIVSANAGAERLFAAAPDALAGDTFDSLLAPDSRMGALGDFNRMMVDPVALHEGREVTGQRRGDTPATSLVPRTRHIPLFMTLGRIAQTPPRLCAIFRDVSLWKNAEHEVIAARRETEKAIATKTDFLAKISHDVRTPLNAIIGFTEVMMSERFGAIGNERYHAYLRDIHTSGNQVLTLLNDLLDLSKIESGRIDLTFASVNLNELTQSCVALVQPQAIKDRIIIRTSLAPALPVIVADARSVRQIILNLLTHSLRLTSAGGQIIVSTTASENGGGVLRVRDTGAGMSEREVAMALEPFRQLSTPLSPEQGGSGLGLPLTKALAEANRAHFTITSALNAGTLVEIAFPPARAAAE